MTPLGPRPQAVAQLAEVIDDPEPFGTECLQLIVELGQASEQLVALDLELESGAAVESRCVS